MFLLIKFDYFCSDINQENPAREAAVAILSTGPVGPSDRVGYSDVTLISQYVYF